MGKASTVMLLALVFLAALTLAPTWSMELLILFGVLGAAMTPDSSPSSSGLKREVFLSFRGPDTCYRFTDFLYHQLVNAGISVFRDEKGLCEVEPIGPEVKEAIKRSRISIAILSSNYASSKCCLNELVQMWECKKLDGQIIIPIFYEINSTDVRDLTGGFGKTFHGQERAARVDSNTIEKWREVLRGVGGLPGYEGNLYRTDHQLVQEVVLSVERTLRDDWLAVTDKLDGIDLHVQEVTKKLGVRVSSSCFNAYIFQVMMRKLGVAYSEGQATEVRGEDIRVIGIYGAPGVGKTTLAKVIFNKMCDMFDACSFLLSVSSKALWVSQNMMIADLQIQATAPLESFAEGSEKIATLFSNAKVLIVLDNVDEDEQIKALAGKLTWFGQGSRIIVTTRKKSVLNAFDGGPTAGQTVTEYEVKPMVSRRRSRRCLCV